ncbi:choline BCCT transporter BetT [Salininema proteolyticum]|uniref:Choline BCCT transporter BetT n=1 Tax=Salininema proteolyticum TaxID=1607685 RepID=A0ABV8TUR1_9ACTN
MPEEPNDTATRPSRTPVKHTVFWGSAIALVAFSVWAIAARGQAEYAIGEMVGWVSHYFGWYYILTGTLVFAFVIILAFSKYGKVKLGPDHSKPDFSVFAWAAMLFAAGIGVDLMFYSVAEPVTQYLAPPTGDAETVEAARQSIVWTLFHYGLTGWAMYTLMGIALAYFSFRHGLSLTIRSALYPIFGKRVEGAVGDAVDIAAVLGTVFGVAVSLGIGVVQLNFGLHHLFGLPQNETMQIALIAVAVLMSTASAVAGIDKGIRRLSELNVILAIGLVVYMMVVQGPIDALNKLVLNVGDYATRFATMTLDTMGYNSGADEWMNAWTLFFWAWWIAWAPFVGLFLAKISRGRTIRQFVGAAMIVPFIFTLLFLSVFGNAALNRVRGGDAAFGETTMATPEQGFYTLLSQYPGATFVAGLATFVGLLFYVTSADSGAIVLGNFTSKLSDPTKDASKWMRVFWSVVLGLLTIAMLWVNGVTALQNATVVMGLPFSFVLYLVAYGLWKALRVETYRAEAKKASLHAFLSERSTEAKGPERSWRSRIGRAMSCPSRKQVERYIETTALPAFESVSKELEGQGVEVALHRVDLEDGSPYLELQVGMGTEQYFTYALLGEAAQKPSFAARTVSESDEYWRLTVQLSEGHMDYDVMGYTSTQLISDVLDHYENHLEFLRLSREAPGSSPIPQDNSGFGEPDLPGQAEARDDETVS